MVSKYYQTPMAQKIIAFLKSNPGGHMIYAIDEHLMVEHGYLARGSASMLKQLWQDGIIDRMVSNQGNIFYRQESKRPPPTSDSGQGSRGQVIARRRMMNESFSKGMMGLTGSRGKQLAEWLQREENSEARQWLIDNIQVGNKLGRVPDELVTRWPEIEFRFVDNGDSSMSWAFVVMEAREILAPW